MLFTYWGNKNSFQFNWRKFYMEDNTSSKVSKNISKNEEKNRIFKAAVGTEIIKIATENSFFCIKLLKK